MICSRQAEKLSSRGHKVFVLSADDPNTGLKREKKDNLVIYRCGIKNLYLGLHRPQGKIKHLFWHIRDSYNYGMRRYVKQVIEQINPNIVICHALVGFSISVWDEIRAHHIPLIQILHDQYLRCPKTNTFKNDKVCIKPCVECKLLRLFHKRAIMSYKLILQMDILRIAKNILFIMPYIFQRSRLLMSGTENAD